MPFGGMKSVKRGMKMDWEREFKGYETELEPSKRDRPSAEDFAKHGSEACRRLEVLRRTCSQWAAQGRSLELAMKLTGSIVAALLAAAALVAARVYGTILSS